MKRVEATVVGFDPDDTEATAMERAQAGVVGVALLLGVTVVALAGVTAGVGTVVDGTTASADAARVSSGMDAALRPVETTGPHEGTVRFASGRLTTVDRQLRVLESGSVVETVAVDGLRFTTGDRRVASVGGALVRGKSGSAWVERDPPISASGGSGGVLVVGAAKLDADHVSVSGEGAAVTLATDVSHHRTDLGTGRYAVALETATPGALARAFRADGATVSRRDVDGDGLVSVVATFPGRRDAYLVVHDMNLEVGDG